MSAMKDTVFAYFRLHSQQTEFGDSLILNTFILPHFYDFLSFLAFVSLLAVLFYLDLVHCASLIYMHIIYGIQIIDRIHFIKWHVKEFKGPYERLVLGTETPLPK